MPGGGADAAQARALVAALAEHARRGHDQPLAAEPASAAWRCETRMRCSRLRCEGDKRVLGGRLAPAQEQPLIAMREAMPGPDEVHARGRHAAGRVRATRGPRAPCPAPGALRRARAGRLSRAAVSRARRPRRPALSGMFILVISLRQSRSAQRRPTRSRRPLRLRDRILGAGHSGRCGPAMASVAAVARMLRCAAVFTQLTTTAKAPNCEVEGPRAAMIHAGNHEQAREVLRTLEAAVLGDQPAIPLEMVVRGKDWSAPPV